MCIYRGARASAGENDDSGMYLVRIVEFGFSSSGTHVVQSGYAQHYIYISLSLYIYIYIYAYVDVQYRFPGLSRASTYMLVQKLCLECKATGASRDAF